MSNSVLYMSMSLDGFIAGPNQGPGNGLGDGGHRLHEWLHPGGVDPRSHRPGDDGPNATVFDEVMSTGAVVAGKRTFEPADGWGGDHHDGVPIFILSRHSAPSWAAEWPAVHYVSDLETAIREAKQAAGDRDVLVHGAGIAQRALTAGLLDELQIHLIPVLLGQGRRLFENLPADHIELDLLRASDGPGVQHVRYRVRSRG